MHVVGNYLFTYSGVNSSNRNKGTRTYLITFLKKSVQWQDPRSFRRFF